MKSYLTAQYWCLILALALLLTACNPRTPSPSTVTPVIQPTLVEPTTVSLNDIDPPHTAPTEPNERLEGDARLVTSVQQARAAVVRVVARGSFVAPQGVLLNPSGKGAGFIIDPSGLAVTHNHVVTGGAFIEVWLNGEDKPRQANVVAVSECSNLALIDIEGSDFPYLEWDQSKLDDETEVWLTGFSLLTSDYTVTKSLVSTQQANGESSWASLERGIEFDTGLETGNSGGPVLSSDGEIVAITYPSGTESDHQAYGIGSEGAQNIVARLQEGRVTDAIGINGRAIAKEDGTMFGVWVSSVKAGSPADSAKIKPGDWIRKLENVVLASDGTMQAYCEVLHGRSPGDMLNVEVWRLSTGEVLQGQINGRELQPVGSLTTTPGNAITASYALLGFVDETGALSVKLPADWELLDGTPATNDKDQPIAARIQAFPKTGMRLGNFSPGVLLRVSSRGSASPEEWLNQLITQGFESCADNGRSNYTNFGYAGFMHAFSGCGETESSVFLLALQHSESEPIIIYRVQGYDKAFVDTVLATLQIDSESLP